MRADYTYLSNTYTTDDARGVGYIPAHIYEKLARLTLKDIEDSGISMDALAELILEEYLERSKSELNHRRARTTPPEEELTEGDTALLDSFLGEFSQRR